MRKNGVAIALKTMTAIGAISVMAPAYAQTSDNVVVMRRVLIAANPSAPTTPGVNQGGWRIGEWSDVSQVCGLAKQTRTVECTRGEENLCSSPKPIEFQDVQGGGTNCTAGWRDIGAGEWNTQCSPTAVRERTIVCMSSSGDVVDPSQCEIAFRPDGVEYKEIYDGCDHSWATGDWSEWSSTCSDSASRTRTVSCMMPYSTSPVDESKCDPETRPSDSETSSNDTGCAYKWKTGEWSGWSSTCSPEATRERTVTCHAVQGDAQVDPSLCTLDRPESTETSEIIDSCGYTWEWQTGEWTNWSSSCSPDARRTRVVQCRRSDGKIDDAGRCDAETRPADRENQANYSACTFEWEAGAFGPWSSTCSQTAEHTREVKCIRTNGGNYEEPVADSFCDPAEKPKETEIGENYTTCTYAWYTGEWDEPPTCGGSVTSTREVKCINTTDPNKEPASEALCNPAEKPAATKLSSNEDGCQYHWEDAGWTAWSSTCSSTATRYKRYACVDAQGEDVGGANCETPAPQTPPEIVENYSGCTYNWKPEYGAWSIEPSCAPSRSRPVTATCMRSDSTPADDFMCDPAARPAAVQTETLPACSVDWHTTAWSNELDLCGEEQVKTRIVTCRREDGVTLPDSSCAGNKPSETETYTNERACRYSWVQTGSADWDTTCSISAARSRTIQCVSTQGEVDVTEQECSGEPKPGAIETAVNTSGCYLLVQNGEMESTANFAPWTVSGTNRSATLSYDGSSAISLTNTGSTGRILQDLGPVKLKKTDTYRLEFYARLTQTPSSSNRMNFYLASTTGQVTHSTTQTIYPSTTWARYTVTFTPFASYTGSTLINGRVTLEMRGSIPFEIDKVSMTAISN